MKLEIEKPMEKWSMLRVNNISIMLVDGDFYAGTYGIMKLEDYPGLTDIVLKKKITVHDYTDPDGLVCVSDYILLIRENRGRNFEYSAVKVPKDPSDEEYKILQEVGYYSHD